MTEEVDGGAEQFALAAFGIQLTLVESLQHFANMHDVFLLCAAEDENVIEKDENTLIQHIAEGVVHQLHERREKRRGDASDATAAVLDAQCTLDPGEIVWPRLPASDDIDTLLVSVSAGDREGDNLCTD